jgi:diguanylate cyclase (GGDEF)-like protein
MTTSTSRGNADKTTSYNLLNKIAKSAKNLKDTIILEKSQYRHSLLNFTLSFYCVAFFIIAPVTLYRTIDTGWLPLNTFHVFLLSLLFIFNHFKNKIPYSTKAILLISVFYSIGAAANYFFGIAAGNYLYFGICILLSATFLTIKRTILILFIIILTQVAFMVLTSYGVITFQISPITQVSSVYFWTSQIVAFVCIISSPLIALGWLNTSLKSSEDSLKSANQSLEVAKQKLILLSQTDELTSLPNRRALFNYADLEFKKFKRNHVSFAVLMIDIDLFKKVNDNYGHDAGDIILKAVSAVLSEQIRDYEIVARYGGEEFVIILQEPDMEICTNIAERIRLAVKNNETSYQNTFLQVTVSIGLSQVLEQDNNIEDVLKRADINLYKAKDDGRNRVVFANA